MSTSLVLASSLLSVANAGAAIVQSALGATTALTDKSTVCNILDYGAVADGETDIAAAVTSAYTDCVAGNNATLYIPEGNYSCADILHPQITAYIH